MLQNILIGLGAGIGLALALVGSIALMLFLVYLFTKGGEKKSED